MDDAGIECGVYYPRLVWDHEVYRRNTSVVTAPAPVAQAAARRCLSLPVHPGLDSSDVERIATELRAALL
jgi:dTDP-4-amino-4,6-dideoxygalactose transaminase